MATRKVQLTHISFLAGAEGAPGDIVEVSDEQARDWYQAKGCLYLDEDGKPIPRKPVADTVEDDDDDDDEPAINDGDDTDADILGTAGDSGSDDGSGDEDILNKTPTSSGRSRRKK